MLNGLDGHTAVSYNKFGNVCYSKKPIPSNPGNKHTVIMRTLSMKNWKTDAYIETCSFFYSSNGCIILIEKCQEKTNHLLKPIMGCIWIRYPQHQQGSRLFPSQWLHVGVRATAITTTDRLPPPSPLHRRNSCPDVITFMADTLGEVSSTRVNCAENKAGEKKRRGSGERSLWKTGCKHMPNTRTL